MKNIKDQNKINCDKDGVMILIFFIILIIIIFVTIYAINNIKQEIKTGYVDGLAKSYNECNNFRDCQNKCLYETRAVDYEYCYWVCTNNSKGL